MASTDKYHGTALNSRDKHNSQKSVAYQGSIYLEGPISNTSSGYKFGFDCGTEELELTEEIVNLDK